MKKQEEKEQSMLELLEEKKRENGRLSSVGEWLLKQLKKDEKGYIAPDGMKYILKGA